jgi:uncharacterized membrane protein YqaE (UPF0057 family)
MKTILTICLLFFIILSAITPSYASLSPVTSAMGNSEPASAKTALAEFKGLSKKEKKLRVKDAKKQWRLLNKKKNSNKEEVDMAVLIILAILLPPLAVYLHQEEINYHFWLSLILWCIILIPGIIYALLVVTDTIE